MSAASDRATTARIAANTRWAYEPDRRAATRPAHRNSPVSYEYHLAKMREKFPDAPADEIAARAENAHRAYMQALSLKAKRAREARRNVA